MTTYLVTLAVEIDPSQSDPGEWPWTRLMDYPYAIVPLASTALSDDPTGDKLIERVVVQAHETVAESQVAAIPPSQRV